MKRLFEFDSTTSNLQIKLAYCYTPKIMHNQIIKRTYSGLLYIVRGRYTYIWKTGSFQAEAGSLIYLPPGSAPYTYCIETVNDETPQTMQVEFDLTDKDGAPICYGSEPIVLTTDAKAICTDMSAVIAAFAQKGVAAKLRLRAAIYNLLAACVEISGARDAGNDSRIAPAVTFLQENYNEQVCVCTLAKMCHLSESQLRRLFHQWTGKSPIAYKNALVLDAAKRLLLNSEHSVGEIADVLGFYDIYAFSHFFSAAEGVSPSAYRKRRKG